MDNSLVFEGLDYMEGRSGCIGVTLYYKNGEVKEVPKTIEDVLKALDNHK